LRRLSPFGEIGLESELAELSRHTVVPPSAVAVADGDDDLVDEVVGETDSYDGETIAVDPAALIAVVPAALAIDVDVDADADDAEFGLDDDLGLEPEVEP
jgi:hypothetical protein